MFSACASEDCLWAGTTRSINSEELNTETLLVGLSSLVEKSISDPSAASALEAFVDKINEAIAMSEEDLEPITVEDAHKYDKSGSYSVYLPTLHKYMNVKEEMDFVIPMKLNILKSMYNVFLFKSEIQQNEEDYTKQKKYFCRKLEQEDLFLYEEYGFPPMNIEMKQGHKGVSSATYEYAQETSIWSPIDWRIIDLSKDSSIRYLAVLQVDGQNFTYVASENMDTGEWMACISQRAFREMESTTRFSKAKNIEEALQKMTVHFDNAYNEMVNNGDPIEIGWSKEFDYSTTQLQVISTIFNSPVFMADISNEMLLMSESSRREVYEEMYAEANQL